MSVPNQKRIRIGERVKRNKDNLYAMMNLDALKEAMRILKGSSLKLWLYFNKNQDKYELELSRVDCQEWGIKKDSYYSAVADLIDKGFLVQMREGSNIYIFCETANSGKQTESFSEKRIQDWENQKEDSEKEIRHSENLERNNTDNTNNKNNKIMVQRKKATDTEKKMYLALAKLFITEDYESEDVEELEKLLQRQHYWSKPEKRIEQMSSAERIALEEYYKKYSTNINGGISQ